MEKRVCELLVTNFNFETRRRLLKSSAQFHPSSFGESEIRLGRRLEAITREWRVQNSDARWWSLAVVSHGFKSSDLWVVLPADA